MHLNHSFGVVFPSARIGEDAPKLLGWNLPSEYQYLVHEHWREFTAPPYYAHLLLGMIYFALMLMSFTGNGIVVWIFSTSKSLRSGSNMFIVNLAIFDIMMGLEFPMFLISSYNEKILGYDIGCTTYAALGSFSGIGGAITNAVIAYDRYRTISNPLEGRFSRAQAGILVAFTWLWAMPFTFLPMFKIWGSYIPEGFLTTCSFDYLTDSQEIRVFVACIFVWAYAFPMCLIVYFYSGLFKHVRMHEKMLKDQAKKMNVESLAANKDMNSTAIEIRIAKAAFTIFFLFVCAWTPYGIVAMTGAFGNKALLTPFATMIPAVCCKIVSCLDPWVYAISHPRYRAELQKRAPWMGITESSISADNISRTESKITAITTTNSNSSVD